MPETYTRFYMSSICHTGNTHTEVKEELLDAVTVFCVSLFMISFPRDKGYQMSLVHCSIPRAQHIVGAQ